MQTTPSEIIPVFGKRRETLQKSTRKRTVTTFKLSRATLKFSDLETCGHPHILQSKHRHQPREAQLLAARLHFGSPSKEASATPPGPEAQKLKTELVTS